MTLSISATWAEIDMETEWLHLFYTRSLFDDQVHILEEKLVKTTGS